MGGAVFFFVLAILLSTFLPPWGVGLTLILLMVLGSIGGGKSLAEDNASNDMPKSPTWVGRPLSPEEVRLSRLSVPKSHLKHVV